MRLATLCTACLAALLLFVAAPMAETTARGPAEGSAGVVVSVRGDVVVERSGERMQVTEGLVLHEGDVVLAREGSHCTGFTPGGESFELPGPGQLQLPGASDEGVLDRVSTWVRRQLTQWIGESRRQPIVTRTLMREWDVETLAPAPLIPAEGGQVRPEDAAFYWSSVAGMDRYRLTFVSEEGDEFERVVRSHRLTVDDLAPGKEYVWKVQPAAAGWTGGPGWRSFRVMTPEEESGLEAALESVDDLDAGVLLLSAGLHEEAVYRLDGAVMSGSDGASARRWRAKTLAEIGLYRDAYEDLILSMETP